MPIRKLQKSRVFGRSGGTLLGRLSPGGSDHSRTSPTNWLKFCCLLRPREVSGHHDIHLATKVGFLGGVLVRSAPRPCSLPSNMGLLLLLRSPRGPGDIRPFHMYSDFQGLFRGGVDYHPCLLLFCLTWDSHPSWLYPSIPGPIPSRAP